MMLTPQPTMVENPTPMAMVGPARTAPDGRQTGPSVEYFPAGVGGPLLSFSLAEADRAIDELTKARDQARAGYVQG